MLCKLATLNLTGYCELPHSHRCIYNALQMLPSLYLVCVSHLHTTYTIHSTCNVKLVRFTHDVPHVTIPTLLPHNAMHSTSLHMWDIHVHVYMCQLCVSRVVGERVREWGYIILPLSI